MTPTPIGQRIANIHEVLVARLAEARGATAYLEAITPRAEGGHAYKIARLSELAGVIKLLEGRLRTLARVVNEAERGNVDDEELAKIIDLAEHR